MIRCENPNCLADIRKVTITITRHDLWQCGDHDERPLTKAFVACSWGCASAMTRDLERSEPTEEKEPF